MVLFLLALLAMGVGIFSFFGGAHPTSDPADDRLIWTALFFAISLFLGLGAGLMWRGASRRLRRIRQARRGFPVKH